MGIRKYIVILLLSNFTLMAGVNDGFMRHGHWKKFRKEIYFGGGVSDFLGELGGLDKIGKDYSPVDLELSLVRPSAVIGYRYKLGPRIAWRNQFNYLAISGADKLTKEKFRNNRNLSFKSNIFELSSTIEFNIPFGKVGHIYTIKHTMMRRMKSYDWQLFGYSGIAGFYFNPKAQYHGTYVALQPLGTEGQGLPGGPKKYRRAQISIPFGLGLRINLNKYWCISLDGCWRKTFTDYIDDVSGVYYDNVSLASSHGNVAANLADPNLGVFPYQYDVNGKTASGLQRGDKKQKDSYLSVNFTVGHYLTKKRGSNTRSKF